MMNGFMGLGWISWVLLIGFVLLLEGCMMMHGSMGGMHNGNMPGTTDYTFNSISVKDNFSLNLEIIISETDGNSKFFIKLENMATGETIGDFESELNLYNIPYDGAPLSEMLDNSVIERLRFSSGNETSKYLNYAFISPDKYFVIINVTSINGTILNDPLSFKYRMNNYEMKNQMQESGLWGVNYWIWGGLMALIMVVMMLGFSH